MTVLVSSEGISPKNSAVLALQNEPAGLVLVFTDNVYAVRVDDGNPWFELFSTPLVWAEIEVQN